MNEKQITICGHGSGNPSLKNMYDYLESRHNSYNDAGQRRELVAVRRCKGLTNAQKDKFVAAYKSILGRNIYSQSYRTYVFTPLNGKYYSDCSSSGDACYGKAGHDVGWLNTAGIYTSGKFEDVTAEIVGGHVKNPEVLEIGDALLFRGNDPSRPKGIGHVEFVYKIVPDGWHWVHSGGKWYYQNDDGVNMHGWALIKETKGTVSHWYYFDDIGAMLTGVQMVGGELCLFMPDGPLEGAMCVSDGKGYQHVWDI